MSAFDASDMSVFFSDFSVEITPTTWGTGAFSGIFDRDFIDLIDVSRESPYFIAKDADIPATAAAGDLFSINSETYKLVDVSIFETGVKRVVLADT